MRKRIELFWLTPGKSAVKAYVPGVDEKSSAPVPTALVFETRVEAVALSALSECLGFLSKNLDVKRLWMDLGEDPERWIKAVKNAGGDPLPVIKAWLEVQLPQAMLEYEQEQREQVMAALAGLIGGGA